MWERFTENSRRIVFYAQEEATTSGAPEVTTEHFLLALLRDKSAFAARVLAEMVSDLGLIQAGVSASVAAVSVTPSQPLVLAEAAQRAFAITSDEARRQNYKNVGPEHLLLGIIGEGANVGARVLTQYGVDADRTRAAITKLRPTQFAAATVSASPSELGALAPKVRPPARFTERARQILVFAREEARRFHSASVATEHMLLGLIRDDDNVAVRALIRVGVPLATLQAEIQRQMIEAGLQPVAETLPSRLRLERLGVNLDAIQAGIQRQMAQAKGSGAAELELTAESKAAIDLACDEAERLHHNFVGTEHLMLGLIREETGLAARALLLSGVDLDRVRDAVAAMHSEARARLLQDDSPFAAASRTDGAIGAGESGGSEAAQEGSPNEVEAAPGDLGFAQADRHRSIVEVAFDRATQTRLAAIFATKDAHGYRALAKSEDGLFLVPDATELKLLLPPADADIMDQEACYVRILSGAFAGRAGWILRRTFRWTGPDNSEFLPEI